MDTPPTRHDEAYALYLSLGPKRSYRAVAEQSGVSVSAVKLWAKQGRWQQRIREREADIAQQSAAKSIETAVTDINQLKKITRLGLVRVAKSLADGRDISKLIADLDRIVRLSTYLDGGPHGPDPNNIDDVRAFLGKIPESILDAIEAEFDDSPVVPGAGSCGVTT